MIRNLSEDLVEGLVEQVDFNRKEIIPGKDYIPVTGKVVDKQDLLQGVDAVLDGWLTAGRYAKAFEKKLTNWFGAKKAFLVNSGSSANLLAFYSLTSPKLGEKAILPGDEVITVAAGFPTTINPLIQYGCIPVFLDINIPTYNLQVDQLEDAITSRTKAIVLAHTLGNPFNLKKVMDVAKKYDLWVIEDDCDALGASFEGKKTGSFGDISTLSFYPAHHITTGEGGATIVNNRSLQKITESFRDWGRDCYCEPGVDNTCRRRFEWKLGDLPFGYDHKYTYSHIGFNLKMTDIQAAIGLSQFEKVERFIQIRRENFLKMEERLKDLAEHLVLPEATENSEPSWFGYMLLLKSGDIDERHRITTYLEKNLIGTRLLFGGNLTKQPAYQNVKYRAPMSLENTNRVMNAGFWLGVWPGLTDVHFDYISDKLHEYFK